MTDRALRLVRTARLWVAVGVALGAGGVGVPGASAVPSEHPFGIVPGSFHVEPASYEAGSHGDLTIRFDFEHSPTGKTYNDLRTVVEDLPPGFVGNNTAVPTCPVSKLLGPEAGRGSDCPPDTQLGTVSFDLTLDKVPVFVTFPLYNVEVTTPGITAVLGFNALLFSQVIPIRVSPRDTSLVGESPETENIGEPHNVVVKVWGVPFAHEHDAERGRQCTPNPIQSPTAECKGGGEQVSAPPLPYLRTPTRCTSEPLVASIRADSWETIESWSYAEGLVAPMVECERVPFNPSIKAVPTTASAESSSGLDVSLEVPQSWEKPETISTSDLKKTVVTLPLGYTVNPSAGSGLVACTEQQYESEDAESLPGTGCPAESKLGTVEIETPVLAQKIDGNIYLAQPYANRFGSLLALYVVAKAPTPGIVVKAAGKVEPDPVTGQLTATFDDTPQAPFSRFTIKFRQGATSPLVSPAACGTYTVLAQLTPWSAPESPHPLASSFAIERGIGGGACPAGGIPPFGPRVISGTQSNAAASYSPFYLRINREDGEQEITKFTTVLPPGLTANLSGVPFCPDAAIQRAREATGQQELQAPSCPAASEIGHSLVGAGVGSILAWTPGRLYLAGPYRGSALSLVSVTSATVGPFDLGTVVIRFALRINPITGQAEIDGSNSDPIPHIIKGIVVHVRDIHVYVDRPRFIINPTSCNPMQIQETITGAGADPAGTADDRTVPAAASFQAADCQNLKFNPAFTATVTSKSSRANGVGLHVKLAYPSLPQGTQANIHYVRVELPKQLPSRLPTLQHGCLSKVFQENPAACPPASRVGIAKAITPILPEPLQGPAYFVSNGGANWPELVLVLQGYGVTIDLHGETFIDEKTGITSSTFRSIPDEPVTSFELTLPPGPYSALAAPGGKLCSRILRMPTTFVAQNGMRIHRSTRVAATGCPRHKAKHGKHAKKHRHKKKK